MFGIGGPELIFILVLALLIFGPKKLPQIGRTLGKGMSEFRKASTELQRAINSELEEPSTTPATRRPALLADPLAAVMTPAAPLVTAAPASPAPPAASSGGEADAATTTT
jgi:sec-independent protein translocase protein TatA